MAKVKKIKSFDRTKAVAFGSELETALAKIAKRYGLTVQLKSRKFGHDNYTARVELSVVNAEGLSQTKEAKAYEAEAAYRGWNKKVGDTFTSRGIAYTITGYNTRARSMPLQANRVSDGAGFKFRPATIDLK